MICGERYGNFIPHYPTKYPTRTILNDQQFINQGEHVIILKLKDSEKGETFGTHIG